jgi:hypothetical protein
MSCHRCGDYEVPKKSNNVLKIEQTPFPVMATLDKPSILVLEGVPPWSINTGQTSRTD